jgi:hypothetical protein
MRGAKRRLASRHRVNRKLALFPPDLLRLHAALKPQSPKALAIWAAVLVGFWGMVRKGGLFPSGRQPNPELDLLVSDLLLCAQGSFIRVSHSKTIQFGERQHVLVFPRVDSSHPLCPFWALKQHFSVNRLAAASSSSHLFVWQSLGTRDWQSLTAAQFDSWFKQLCSTAGLRPNLFSGHSLRRGGASTALSFGLSREAIAAIGDWRSAAVECYLQAQVRDLQVSGVALARRLREQFPSPLSS